MVAYCGVWCLLVVCGARLFMVGYLYSMDLICDLVCMVMVALFVVWYGCFMWVLTSFWGVWMVGIWCFSV